MRLTEKAKQKKSETERNETNMVEETKRNEKYIEYQETERNGTISLRIRNEISVFYGND
jgi:hypothetical protein